MADIKERAEALKQAGTNMLDNINKVRSFFGGEPLQPAPKPAASVTPPAIPEKMVGQPIKKEEFK